MLKRISVGLAVIVACAAGLEFGERLGVPGVHGFVTAAQAVVGRPLTPVSYAGVARRTSRRCEAGMTC
jgi:hypothetical protein